MKNDERFLRYVIEGPGCWIWRGGINNLGYGVFYYRGKNIGAHRFALMRKENPPHISAWALHTCDTKSCVNPKHLYWGDLLANTKDAIERKRMATFDRHGLGKLSESDCMRIKEQYQTGMGSHRELGKLWRVDNTTIGRAIKRADALIAELAKGET